ncbi:hypothetical protein LOTGIDRAFT_159622 [Lottia gigantea]|uniref:Coiled-coil domain-containing protein 186 n=1 Tax=Lottia gigantea TaxID=225164 RepID=V4AIP4_LOTGI|nr:hypothetical protein LOTGIDRAFT_159622 [Lottia gigantea]ESO96872.1 hypothetical protein LOTGIDRAFT_159622 [Lottia gigantea]
MSGRLPSESEDIENENPESEADVDIERENVDQSETSESAGHFQQDALSYSNSQNDGWEALNNVAQNGAVNDKNENSNVECEAVESEMVLDSVNGSQEGNQLQNNVTSCNSTSFDCVPQIQCEVVNKIPADQAPECDQAMTDSCHSSSSTAQSPNDLAACEGQENNPEVVNSENNNPASCPVQGPNGDSNNTQRPESDELGANLELVPESDKQTSSSNSQKSEVEKLQEQETTASEAESASSDNVEQDSAKSPECDNVIVCDKPVMSDTKSQSPDHVNGASETRSADVHSNSLQHDHQDRENIKMSVIDTEKGAQNSESSKNVDKIGALNTTQSQSEPDAKNKPRKFPISRKSPPGIDFLHLSDSSEDELLNELDAALLNRSHSQKTTPTNSARSTPKSKPVMQEEKVPIISLSEQTQNGFKQFPLKNSQIAQNVEETIESLKKELQSKNEELKSAKVYSETLQDKFKQFEEEKKMLATEVKMLREQNADNLYLPQIKEMEKTIASQQKEIQQTKETLASHDNMAKRKIASMQNDYKARIDQVTKMYEDCLREKDTMVVNYAVAEQKNIEAKKATERAEQKYRDCLKEQEAIANKCKSFKAEKQKAVADYETKQNELSGACKEIERMKEMLTSADVRIKWAQNKLKSELESHKETKIELEKTNQKLKMAREETLQIRKDCQAIIKTYQESEEIKSNSLDKELKLKESELIVQRQEKSDSQEVYNMTVKELEVLKAKYKDAAAELKTLRDKVYCLESERKDNEETMTKYQEIIQSQKGENKSLLDKLGNHGQLNDDFDRAQDMIKTLDREISELRINNKDLQSDIEGCRTRETELLDLTQKLSRTNAKLQSENTNANNQVVSLSGKNSNMEMEIHNLQATCNELSSRLAEDGNKFENECTRLKAELTEKNISGHCYIYSFDEIAGFTVSEFKQKLEDEKDLNKVLKRKHANNVKDITRQLQQARKKLESFENHHGEKDGTSLGSRTSSNGSLNTITDQQTHQSGVNNNNNPHSATNPHHTVQPRPPEPEYPVITEQVEVDKQVLIERIVRLQKAHARKNEKLEFLQDHIHQLVDEVQRKKKIIQSYILREEQGALAPEAMDENKRSMIRSEVQALLAKKGGIMASLYSHHSQDGHMTLDLSLEINQKLQGVLEDTLLKNITLKENIDTLGTEIARLSKENRQIQLKLQSQR